MQQYKRCAKFKQYNCRLYSTTIGEGIRPFKSKKTLDLLNSYAVFQICGIPAIVNMTPNILKAADRMHLSSPLNCAIKQTFFKHFCGGENVKEVLPTIETFKASGIGSILDLAIEADLDSKSMSVEDFKKQTSKISVLTKESIDIASSQSGNCIATKITAFVPPIILLRWTNTLQRFKESFVSVMDNDGYVDQSKFSILSNNFPLLKGQCESLFKIMDHNSDGKIDWIDVSSLFSIFNPQARLLLQDKIDILPEHKQVMTIADFETAKMVWEELFSICEYAKEKRVRLFFDAEQTYFQAAIDDFTLGLCRKYNETTLEPTSNVGKMKYALIYNTYQLYLKDGCTRLVADVERSKRFGFSFGVKIVRGAYMASERERARELQIDDPINESIEETHKSYNQAIDFLIETIANSDPKAPVQPLRFVVASHNEYSVKHACDMMTMKNIDASDGTVSFAQLMGMQDGTTFGLASLGIKVYKYIPYGPVSVTIPYLHRRAQENSSLLGGAEKDKKELLKELKIRLFNR